jgi:cold shock CspA family protein
MADSFNKKEREKKRRKKKKDKQYNREQKKLNSTKPPEFMYVGEDGNLTTERPDPKLRKKVDLEDIDISTPRTPKTGGSKYEKSGFVKFLNTDKGYGFIADNNSGDSYFVHINDLDETIQEGSQVTFEAGSGPKGPIALKVKVQS